MKESQRPSEQHAEQRRQFPREARCHCGHLVAKVLAHGVELKCKRCKRIIVLPFHSGRYKEFHFEPCPS